MCVFFGFQFGTPSLARALSLSLELNYTHTNTHTLSRLPGYSPSTASPSNSQQAPRQTGQADCSTQQRGSRPEESGEGSAYGGHQSADTPKSFSGLAEVYSNVRYFLFYIWRLAQGYMGRLPVNSSKIVIVCKMTCYFLTVYLYANPAPFTTLIHLNRWLHSEAFALFPLKHLNKLLFSFFLSAGTSELHPRQLLAPFKVDFCSQFELKTKVLMGSIKVLNCISDFIRCFGWHTWTQLWEIQIPAPWTGHQRKLFESQKVFF